MTANEKSQAVVKALEDKKASNIEVIDVKERTSLSKLITQADSLFVIL